MITIGIIIITVLISLYANSNSDVYYKLLYSPYLVTEKKQWYRIISHGFIHSQNNIFHLIINMYVLYLFGSLTEKLYLSFLGPRGYMFYIMLYLGGLIAASLPALKKHKNDYTYNAVGASGAVSAVDFSSILFIPLQGITFIFFPFFSIPAFIFGALYLIYEYYMSKRAADGIGHDAHFAGALFGIAFTIIVIPQSFFIFINQIKDFFG